MMWLIWWHLSYWCLVVLSLLYRNLTFHVGCAWSFFSELMSNPFLLNLLGLRLDPPFLFVSWVVCHTWPASPQTCSFPFPALLCAVGGWPLKAGFPRILCQLVSGWVWSMKGISDNGMVGGREAEVLLLSFPESMDSSLMASMADPLWLRPPPGRPTVISCPMGNSGFQILLTPAPPFDPPL